MIKQKILFDPLIGTLERQSDFSESWSDILERQEF